MPTKISSIFVSLGAQIENFDKGFQKAEARLRNTAKGFTAVGARLTRSLTIPIGIAGGLAVKSAIDFESAFAGVRKTVDGTEDQLSDLREGILEMSRVMPASAVEISGVAEAAGQLGIATDDVLGFTETMIKLSEATDIAAKEGAAALARFAGVTGLASTEYDNLASSIVAVGNNARATEGEILDISTRLAGAANTAGLAQSEVVALAAAIRGAGIQTEAGGTAATKVILEMSKAALSGGKNLEVFASVAGKSADEFSRAFQDNAANALQEFLRGLRDLEKSEAEAAIEALGLDAIRTGAVLRGLSSTVDDLSRLMDISRKSFEEASAADREFEERLKTVAAQLKVVRNRLVAAGIAIGESLLPLVRDTINVVANLADKFGDLSPLTQKLTVGFAAFAAALGPALSLFGNFLRLAKGAAIALTALLSPAGLITAGVLAAATAFTILGTESARAAVPVGSLSEQVDFFARELADARSEAQQLARSIGAIDAGAFGVPESAARALEKQLQSLNAQIDRTRESFEKTQAAEILERAVKEAQAAGVAFEAAAGKIDELGRKLDLSRARLAAFTAARDELSRVVGAGNPQLQTTIDLIAQEKERLAGLEEQLRSQTEARLENNEAIQSTTEAMAAAAAAQEEFELKTLETFDLFESLTVRLQDTFGKFGEVMGSIVAIGLASIEDFTHGFGAAVGEAAVFGESFGKSMSKVFKNMAANIISSLVALAAQMLIFSLFSTALAKREALQKAAINAAEVFGDVYSSVVAALPFPINVILAPIIAGAAAAVMFIGATAFGEGGIVMGPTMGLVGEAGPEVIFPLDRLDQFMGDGRGGDIHLTLEIDGRQAARAVVPNMPGEIRRRIGSSTI